MKSQPEDLKDALAWQNVSRLALVTELERFTLFRQTVILLAEGSPAPVGRIAAGLGRSPGEVSDALRRQADVEWDEAGNVVGFGLTLRPTRHRVLFSGRSMYSWCALDALILPSLIGHRVEVQSACAATGAPVRAVVAQDGVEQLDPPEAVVSVALCGPGEGVRHSFCEDTNFFATPDVANAWQGQHPGSVVLPVRRGWRLGMRLLGSARSKAKTYQDVKKASKGPNERVSGE
ncbi:MAG: alkylmercury lyase MerB [Anaerolineales bacterium]